MALHTGLLWLADGYEKCDNSLRTNSPCDTNPTFSDNGCDNPSYKLNLSNCKSSIASSVKPSQATSTECVWQNSKVKSACSWHGKNREHVNVNRHNSKIQRYYTPQHKNKHCNAQVPVNRSPRVGTWSYKPTTSRSASCKPPVELEYHYYDLPHHPDLRYFDRHNQCFNNTHCNSRLHLSRPQTACSFGRQSLEQCKCCGEITSKIRYKYAPTGSAMTANNRSNKTFLYPEKILSYDSSTGRRRPLSAPAGRTVSHSCRIFPVSSTWSHCCLNLYIEPSVYLTACGLIIFHCGYSVSSFRKSPLV